ncbi:MAG: hypothetical protein QM571_01800 [Micrococcaceae bacterium]
MKLILLAPGYANFAIVPRTSDNFGAVTLNVTDKDGNPVTKRYRYFDFNW